MPVEIAKLSPALGAGIEGLDLRQPLDDAATETVHAALLDHCVLFFPGQDITPDQQVAFSRQFGHVPKVPDTMFRVLDSNAYVSVLENDESRPPTVNNWHSDYSFAAKPDFASVLRAVEVPDIGGDTIWVNMHAAYEALSDRMQRHLDGLTAVHDYMKLYERDEKKALWEGERHAAMENGRLDHPPVAHPVVRTHPETKRRALFVNDSFTRHICDMSTTESRGLLEYLFRHIALPEFQIRHSWRKDTIAFWDNRCTVHYAVADYFPSYRLMHRVTVLKDEVPE